MRYGALWVDDEKPAPSHLAVEVIRNYPAALDRLMEGDVHTLYLDYVLGPVGSPTGEDLLREYVRHGGVLPEVVEGISSSASCNQLIRETVEQLKAAGAKQQPDSTPDVSRCRGCHDDFYNRGDKRCWSLESARIVRRWRIHRNMAPTVREAFTEVEVYHCRTETNYVFQEKLPSFAVHPRRLPVIQG